jgi:hypothetical protein
MELANHAEMHSIESGRAERGERDLRISTSARIARRLSIAPADLLRRLEQFGYTPNPAVCATRVSSEFSHSDREQRICKVEVLSAAYARKPERFVNRPPVPPQLPVAAWINRPAARRRPSLTKFRHEVPQQA